MSSRPVIILSRHAGPGDAFLLIYGLLAYAGRRPLPVLKNTLVLDPWIDVLFGRVPHCFIRPSPRAGDRAAAQISDLAAGMGEQDALVLFPEGGNFTPGRRLRAIGRLRRRGQPTRASQATQLEHVLPPRSAGVLAAIHAAPQTGMREGEGCLGGRRPGARPTTSFRRSVSCAGRVLAGSGPAGASRFGQSPQPRSIHAGSGSWLPGALGQRGRRLRSSVSVPCSSNSIARAYTVPDPEGVSPGLSDRRSRPAGS